MQKDLEGNPWNQMHIKMTMAGSRGRREGGQSAQNGDVFGDLSGSSFLGENIKNTLKPGRCDILCVLPHGRTVALLFFFVLRMVKNRFFYSSSLSKCTV